MKKLSSLIAQLEQCDAVVNVMQTRATGHATDLAHASIGKCDAVVAVGGDGTLAEVISGIAGSDQVMGLIPFGTANSAAIDMGFASRFHIRWPLVVKTLLSGEERPLYIGRLTQGQKSRYFILMAGVGFDGQIVENLDLDIKKRWGKWAYARTGLAELASYSPADLRIGDVKADWAIAANGRFYGGPFQVSKHASLQDRGLIILAIRASSRLKMLRALWDLARGKLERQDYVHCLNGTRFEIKSEVGGVVPVQVDGDYFSHAPVSVEAIEKPISFLFPKTVTKAKSVKK